jgi:uncharacterized damage-inducible protein DinB
MQNTMIPFATYNVWANEAFLSRLSMEKEEILNQEVLSSFPTIIKTLNHMDLAQQGWLNVLKGDINPWEYVPKSSKEDAFKSIRSSSEELRVFVEMQKASWWTSHIAFQSRSKDFRKPVWQIVQTILNHSTYHRGQIVTMMRVLGLSEIPQTDLIHYYRQTEEWDNLKLTP